jgi:hypothetical protein
MQPFLFPEPVCPVISVKKYLFYHFKKVLKYLFFHMLKPCLTVNIVTYFWF